MRVWKQQLLFKSKAKSKTNQAVTILPGAVAASFLSSIAFVLLADCAIATPSKPCKEYLATGSRLMNSGKFERALTYLTNAIAVDANCAEAYKYRASCFLQLEKFDAALEDANKTISLVPDAATAYGVRARVYNERNNFRLAVENFSKAIALSTKSPDYLYYMDRGILYKEHGDREKAISDFTSALKIRPQQTWTHYFRACILFDQGKYKDAIADLTDSIRFNPPEEKGAFYQLRAKCYDKLGQPGLAKKDRDTALSALDFDWGVPRTDAPKQSYK